MSADKVALWFGYAVMFGGGFMLTGMFLWLAAEATWKAWRAWNGFFNIVEAFRALREKQEAAANEDSAAAQGGGEA